jgi:hypothetical protein
MTKLTEVHERLFLDRKYRGLRRGSSGSMDAFFIKKSDILKMDKNLDKNISIYIPEYYDVWEYKSKRNPSYNRLYMKNLDSINIGCKQYSKAEFKSIIKKVKSIK